LPSKTDYFTENSAGNRQKIYAARLTKDDVDFMKNAREYTSYEELEKKLTAKFPDEEIRIDKIITALKTLESEGILKW